MFPLLFLCVESPAFGQLKYDFHQFWHETGSFVSGPFNWQTQDWLNVSLVGVGTLFALQADLTVRKEMLLDRTYFNSMEAGRVFGELYSPPVFFGAFAAYSLITNDLRARKIAYEIGQSSLYAAGIVAITKIIVGRARPSVSDSEKSFLPFRVFSLGDDYHSFPSGHTAVAFVISTVLSRNIVPLWGKILVYAPALYTATSRVYQNFHWSSDVFAGAFIGYFVAKWAVDLHERGGASIGTAASMKQSVFQPSAYLPLITIPIN
ncbi:MAG: phosphatase PAP2 family protein [Bacteroidota bacterium]|nr:phosphatase PAP2 family protein [Bacteroidota bacterium]